MFYSNYGSARTHEGTCSSFSRFLWIFSVTDIPDEELSLGKSSKLKTLELFMVLFEAKLSQRYTGPRHAKNFGAFSPSENSDFFDWLKCWCDQSSEINLKSPHFGGFQTSFGAPRRPEQMLQVFPKSNSSSGSWGSNHILCHIMSYVSPWNTTWDLDVQWSLKWWANTEIPSTVTSWTIDHHLSVRRYSGRGTHSRSLPFSCGLHLNIQRRECAFTAVTFIEHSHN